MYNYHCSCPRKMESARIACNREINATGALHNAIICICDIPQIIPEIVIITLQDMLNYSVKYLLFCLIIEIFHNIFNSL